MRHRAFAQSGASRACPFGAVPLLNGVLRHSTRRDFAPEGCCVAYGGDPAALRADRRKTTEPGGSRLPKAVGRS